MSQFTPGPWKRSTLVAYAIVTDNEVQTDIALVTGRGTPEADANAALIARAPDLLRERDELREALVACAAALDPHLDRMLQQQGACGDTFRANARAEARAALSKVTP